MSVGGRDDANSIDRTRVGAGISGAVGKLGGFSSAGARGQKVLCSGRNIGGEIGIPDGVGGRCTGA